MRYTGVQQCTPKYAAELAGAGYITPNFVFLMWFCTSDECVQDEAALMTCWGAESAESGSTATANEARRC